jgi:hypothetical protein
MKKNEVKLLAVVGVSAVATLGVLGVVAGQEPAGAGSVASSGMTTGVTVTATVPTTPVAVAVPTEEQGLPG